MADVTTLLSRIEQGSKEASAELLPLVYAELRELAVRRMAKENPGNTLQSTALVHEAWLRLVGSDAESAHDKCWNSRGHFFGAAAEAMRRILVESARRKSSLKRGGDYSRQRIDLDDVSPSMDSERILAVHEALDKLHETDSQACELVKLRYFVGFTIEESAQSLGISPRKCNQLWAYARAWLLAEIGE